MHTNPITLKTLNNALGQVEAVIKMTEENRYCIDISTQISASIALLKKAQKQILADYLNSCVIDSIKSGNPQEKIDEINDLIKKIL